MHSTNFRLSRTAVMLLCGLFVLAGLELSPLYFGGAFLLAGLHIAGRRRMQGYAVASMGLLYFLLVLGYGIGEELALRDNARETGMAGQSATR